MAIGITAFITALLYSFIFAILGPMTVTQSFVFKGEMIPRFIICLLLCVFINYVCFRFVPELNFKKADAGLSKTVERIGKRRVFLILWAFVFLSWVPAFLILFPGVLSYDSISQTEDALGVISNNHHPVLHTWLLRVFMRFGESVFHSYEAGLGFLSLLQMILLSFSVTRLVAFLYKRKVPVFLNLIVIILSAFWFQNAIMSVTFVKDTLHGAFLILFTIHFVQIATKTSEYVSHKANFFLFPVIAFLMFATRNNGLHIYIFCFAILLLIKLFGIVGKSKRRRTEEVSEKTNPEGEAPAVTKTEEISTENINKKSTKGIKLYIILALVIILPVILFKIYTGPVFRALNIEQGQVREALSLPTQQLQRVAIVKGYMLTDEQLNQIDYYITDLSWREWDPGRKYDPFNADPAKACFISEHYTENPIAFWRLYFSMGRRFPAEYVKAFLSNTAGFWYPGAYIHSYVMYDNYAPEEFTYPLYRKSLVHVPFLEKIYSSLCSSEFLRKTSGVRLFFVTGFVTWQLIFAIVLSWRKKGFFQNVLPVMLPLIAQLGIMYLSPITSFRYSWAFYLILPVVFIPIFGDLSRRAEIDIGQDNAYK